MFPWRIGVGGIGCAVALAGGLVTAATLTGCSQDDGGSKPDQHLDVIGDDAWIVTGGRSSPARWSAPPWVLLWRTRSMSTLSLGRAGVKGGQT